MGRDRQGTPQHALSEASESAQNPPIHAAGEPMHARLWSATAQPSGFAYGQRFCPYTGIEADCSTLESHISDTPAQRR
jgi:hypothetical protein